MTCSTETASYLIRSLTMSSSSIKTVHITSDGKEFSDLHEAEKHAEYLELSKKASETINSNLAQFLANKSKLKAGTLKRDSEELERAWEKWVKTIPKTKNETIRQAKLEQNEPLSKKASMFEKIYDALYALEKAACKYSVHQKQLQKAREYIPKLNAAIKGGPDFMSKDLIMVTPGTVSNW